jgi:hypothetical protein
VHFFVGLITTFAKCWRQVACAVAAAECAKLTHMNNETTYDVVCYPQCSWCRRKATGITQASAERAVAAYLTHLDNLPLPERAACILRLTPACSTSSSVVTAKSQANIPFGKN